MAAKTSLLRVCLRVGILWVPCQAISRLADGREIAVQLLSADENVGESDVILGVRGWHVCDRKIDPVVDLIISKHSTFAQLRDTIATMADLDGFMPEPEPEREPEQETEQETELDQEIDSLAEPRTAAEIEPECEPEPELKAPRLRRLGLAKTSAFGPPLDHRVRRCTLRLPPAALRLQMSSAVCVIFRLR